MKLSPVCCFLLSLALFSCSQNHEQEKDKATAGAVADPQARPTDTLAIASSLPELDSALYQFQDGAILINWKTLADVTFEEEYSEEVQAYVPYPDFGASVQALSGQEVIIEGYVIPLEETGDETILVLSAQPYKTCFFCGGAGPETVMDIKLQPGEPKRYTTDDRVAFRGRLRLNDSDLYYLNYILEMAVPTKIR